MPASSLLTIKAAADFGSNVACSASNSAATNLSSGMPALFSTATIAERLYLGSNTLQPTGQAPVQITADGWSAMQSYLYGTSYSKPTTRAVFRGVAQDHSAFVDAGKLYVCGRNDRGQLGLGHTSNAPLLTQVPGVSNASNVACGQGFTVVTLTDGTALAMGANDYGQLGDGSTVAQSNPVRVLGVSNAVLVSAGYGHAAFWLSNATTSVIAGFGAGAAGQLGAGASSNASNASLVYAAIPNQGATASNGSNVRGLACGAYHTVFCLNNGTAWACGSNAEGQCAAGSTTAQFASPTRVASGLSQVVGVGAGEAHTVLVQWDGGVWCAGRNASGQCGLGSNAVAAGPILAPSNALPAPAGVNSNAAGFKCLAAGGAAHTVVARYDGAVLVFGSNDRGQLGAGAGAAAGSYLTPTRNPLQYATPATAYGVACGKNHTLLLLNNDATEAQTNRVVATGDNTYGQVGDYAAATLGPASNLLTARLMPAALFDASAVLTKRLPSSMPGASHTAVVDADGTLYVAGNNGNGQLGDGSAAARSNLQPVATLGARAAVAVTAGQAFTAAVDGQGNVHTCGANGGGQLGNNSTAQSAVTVNVSSFGSLCNATVVGIGAGWQHILAMDATGAVHAWGCNAQGQLGVNDKANRSNALLVSGGSLAGKAAVGVAAGQYHSVAVDSTGAVHCWGCNSAGQLGANDTVQRSNPALASGSGSLVGRVVTAVAAGGAHVAALDSLGAVHTWGSAASGQLGANDTVDRSNAVLASAFGSLAGRTVVAVAAGQDHTLAVDATGAIHGWGSNGAGQLGVNDTVGRSNPVLISTFGSLAGRTVVAVRGGVGHTVALDSTGGVHVWGRNSEFQLGLNDGVALSNPTLVSSNVRDYYRAGGVVFSKGGLGDHKLMMSRPGPSNLLVIGNNSNAQLGDGTTTSRASPSAGPVFTSNVVAAASGWQHSGAVLQDGRAYLWGRNHLGQCGTAASNNAASNVLTPALLAGVSNAAGVACGSNCTLLRLADGTVQALGDNGNFQLGVGANVATSNGAWAPVPVPGLAGVTAVAVGAGTGLACDASGNLWAWGTNSNGATGRGTSNGVTSNPVLIDGSNFAGAAVTKVAVGDGHAAVVTAKGLLYTCGLNDQGQLGTASNFGTGSPVPAWQRVYMADGSSNAVIDVACGARHTVAHLANGTTRQFGRNIEGQLGTAVAASNQWQPDAGINGAATMATAVAASANATLCEMVDRTTRKYGSALGNVVGVGQLWRSGAGGLSAAAVSPAGQLLVWGTNGSGQLGLNDTANRSNAVLGGQLGSLAGRSVAAVAYGANHMLAIDTTGALHAVGQNTGAQLGVNDQVSRSNPVLVSSGSLAGRTVVAAVAGTYHSVAVDSTGAVHAWGSNQFGSCGQNDTVCRSNPVLVSGGSLAGRTVVAVATGSYAVCALDSTGVVHGWGLNTGYQLGLGDAITRSNPVLISSSGSLAGKTVTAITCASSTGFAIDTTGTAHSWGFSGNGETGTNTTGSRTVPTVMSTFGSLAGRTVMAVAGGNNHAVAVDTTGAVHTWGGSGATGVNDAGVSRSNPVQTSSFGTLVGRTVIAVAASQSASAAIDSTGAVHTWGTSANGALGVNDNVTRSNAALASAFGALSNTPMTPAAVAFTPFTVNFTGQHRVFVAGADPATQEGFVVVCDREDYIMPRAGPGAPPPLLLNSQPSPDWVRGKEAMTINDALPLVSVSRKAYDKRVFGVVSTKTEALASCDAARNAATDAQSARLREQGDVRVQINAIGEGCLWVCDASGSTLESGDYVTSSDVPGYAMLQAGAAQGVMMNYTVAKLTRGCDFTAPRQPRYVVQRDVNGLPLLDDAEGGKPRWVQAADEVRVWRDDATGEPRDPAADPDALVRPEQLAALNVDEVGQRTALVQTPATEPAYDVRWLLPDGTRISEAEYALRKAAGEPVLRAAFLGCTYHCG